MNIPELTCREAEEFYEQTNYYLIERAPFGQGGMSCVYLALDKQNKPVAVKMLHPNTQLMDELEVSKARFDLETRVLQQVCHPNIVPLLDCGTYKQQGEEQLYYVMPYYKRGSFCTTLSTMIKGREEFVVKTLAEVCDGLQYVHNEKKVIHRDIKLGNIFIDNTGKPRIADFGIARNLEEDSTLTSEEVFLGTPEYSAPEKARCEEIETPLSDVYAVGVCLFAALYFENGRYALSHQPVFPYEGRAGLDIIVNIANNDKRKKLRLREDIKNAKLLHSITTHLLARDYRTRPSAKEAARMLRRWLNSPDNIPAGNRVVAQNLNTTWIVAGILTAAATLASAAAFAYAYTPQRQFELEKTQVVK